MAVMLLVGSAGCDDGENETSVPVEPEPAGVTWTGEIRDSVAENCTTCHYAGSAAPFVFETHEQVANASGSMLDAMSSGRMPPWPADPACRTLEGERLISPEDVTNFEAWIAADMPAGAAAEPITFEPPTFDADLTLQPANPYTPQLSAQGDDYRCLILDGHFDAPTWITGATVEPGSAAVHHVITFALTPEQGEIVRMLDAQAEGEGYPCFGGPLPESECNRRLASLPLARIDSRSTVMITESLTGRGTLFKVPPHFARTALPPPFGQLLAQPVQHIGVP